MEEFTKEWILQKYKNLSVLNRENNGLDIYNLKDQEKNVSFRLYLPNENKIFDSKVRLPGITETIFFNKEKEEWIVTRESKWDEEEEASHVTGWEQWVLNWLNYINSR